MRINYALTITILLALFSCREDSLNGNAVAVVIDVTDTFSDVNNLSADAFKPYFKSLNNSNAGANFYLATTSNLRYTGCIEASVAKTDNFNNNVLSRKKEVTAFFEKIQKGINQVREEKIGRNGSYVTHAIARALHHLTKTEPGTKRTLRVYSDMMENTSILNFYNPQIQNLLINNPDSICHILDREYPLPDIQGITIQIVFSPRNSREDDNFHRVSRFWKSYYTKKGASAMGSGQ